MTWRSVARTADGLSDSQRTVLTLLAADIYNLADITTERYTRIDLGLVTPRFTEPLEIQRDSLCFAPTFHPDER
jgi:hypothetical protein